MLFQLNIKLRARLSRASLRTYDIYTQQEKSNSTRKYHRYGTKQHNQRLCVTIGNRLFSFNVFCRHRQGDKLTNTAEFLKKEVAEFHQISLPFSRSHSFFLSFQIGSSAFYGGLGSKTTKLMGSRLFVTETPPNTPTTIKIKVLKIDSNKKTACDCESVCKDW